MLPPPHAPGLVPGQEDMRYAPGNQTRRDGSISIAVDAESLVGRVAFHPDMPRRDPDIRVGIRSPCVDNVALQASDSLD